MENSSSSSAFRSLRTVSSFLIIIALSLLVVSSTGVKATGNHHEYWSRWIPAKQAAACRGSIGECMGAGAGGGEFEMDSESNRRILATDNYISYGALQSNTVPCSVRGASYYNCQTGAQANPYSRGCSAITQCRS
ncbi:rapid alkalinization factor-like [Rhododendron vialii]|uniref:rapid alkalinization factor-like n=1 Tax=Rhododendron vialii TaxID=182163 RepID=UPI00265EF4B6|nr:rapid alkalinization factor-like [Rhododendron vialii]